MEQSGAPAGVHLPGDGGEILVILHMRGGDIEDEITSSIGAGRHHPIGIGGHDQVNEVTHGVGVYTLGLDKDRLLGDQALEHTLGGMVTGGVDTATQLAR